MELRSRKLPSPFQPVLEDYDDAEDVTPTRSFPSDDTHIPPSGIPARDGYHDPARDQHDPDLEDLLFPLDGFPEPSHRQYEEDAMHPPGPDGRDYIAARRPPTPTPGDRPGVANRNLPPLIEEQGTPDQWALVEARPQVSTAAPTYHTAGPSFQPISRDSTTSSHNRHGDSQPFHQPRLPQPFQSQPQARLSRQELPPGRRARSPTPELPRLRCPWRESPERQNRFLQEDEQTKRWKNYDHPRRHNEMACQTRENPPSRPWVQFAQPGRHYQRDNDHRPWANYDNNYIREPHLTRSFPTDRSMPERPRYDEPRPSFPTFNGRSGEWDAFWIQFELLSRRYGWTGDKLVEQLLLSLKGEAMTFVASLNAGIRHDELLLIRALKERFSHTARKETHRANLSHIRRSSKESLQEYASRVQSLMSKAYPDIRNTDSYDELLVQHFLNGIQDQTLAYEVLIRQPRTLNEAIDLVSWHECCKETTRKRSGLRHIKSDLDDEPYSYQHEDHLEDEFDTELRRLNNRRFITEERLQQVLRDLKRNFGISIPERGENDPQHSNHNNRPPRKITCYTCGKEGHISPKCPNKKTSEEQLSENFRGLDLMAKNQPEC